MKHTKINKVLEISIWSIIALGLIASLSACGAKHDDSKVELKGVERIIVFGDSIATGNNSGYNSYAKYISNVTDIPVINLAVPGTTLISNQQYSEIITFPFIKTDLVLYTPGINDLAASG